MQNNKKFLITITVMVLMVLSIFQPGITATASNKPILQPAKDNKVFNPTTVGNDGLYIINSNTTYSNMYYKNPNQATGTFTTYVAGSSNYYSSTIAQSVNNQKYVGSYFSSNSLSTINHPNNPFLNDTYNVPILASLNNNQSSVYLQDTAPFSLHLDQSMTVFLQQGKTYYGMIDHFGNLLMDFDVKDSSASVNVNFINSYPTSITIHDRNTVPLIDNGTNRFLMSITTNSDTFLTIVPHNLPQSKIVSDNIPVNSTDIFTVNQGQCFSSSGSSITPSHSDIMSINSFAMHLTKDSYYEIFVNKQNLDSSSSACSSVPSRIDSFYTSQSGIDYQPVYNPNGGNGYTIKALKTGDLKLFLEFIGYHHLDTSVFFRQITAPKTGTVQSLPLNTKIGMIPNIYYTFNTTAPRLFAINYTNSAIQASLPVNIYTLNQQTEQWDQVSTTSFSTYGNLYQSGSSTTIPNIFQYLPAGQYAIRSTSNDMTNLNYQLTVNLLAINQLNMNNHLNIPVNNNTLVAFELHPQSNTYNFLNLSTDMHDNISVNYNYRIFSKYYEGMNGGYTIGGNYYFGNMGNTITNNWFASSKNNSAIYEFYKNNDMVAPIVILAPYQVTNLTNSSPLGAYNTFVNISLNAYGGNYISTPVTVLNPSYLQNSILSPSYLTSTASALINNDKLTSQTQTFIFNLETQPDSLYNVSVYAFGNASGLLNVTSLSFTTSGGKYTDLNSYYKPISGSNTTAMYESQNILTQTKNTVLSVSVTRSNFGYLANASLFIQMKNLNVQQLTFNQTDLRYIAWNQTHSKFESKDTSTLFKIIKDVPSKTSPIDPLSVVLAFIALPVVKKVSKRKNLKKNN